MYNRTDCAVVFMGELACRVCQEWKMELSERQLIILGMVSHGDVFLNSSKAQDKDYQYLVAAGLIECANMGHFTPTIFLTEKGGQVLREAIR